MTSDPQADQQAAADRDEANRTGPTVHDRRRIDPETGQARPPQSAAAGGSAGGPAADPAAPTDPTSPEGSEASGDDPRVAELTTALADRTADLQRLQAEYVNYKRRIDRDRDVARNSGIEAVMRELLTVLDNIHSAREHEEMSAGFRAVADEVERVASKHGLEAYGEAGENFDPHVHEALMHSEVSEVAGVLVTEPTCAAILQPGYRIKDKIIRPARVAVAEPSADAAPVAGSEPASD